MKKFVRSLWNNEEGQDIAEYAVMLAVILVNRGGHDSLDRVECQQRILLGRQCDSVTALRSIRFTITPDQVKRVDFERIECPNCGKRFRLQR